jgi:hypothetical protein
MGYITNSGREYNKIRGGGDQSQAVQPYTQRYGNRRETGHNARTCQGLILSSNHDDLYNSN